MPICPPSIDSGRWRRSRPPDRPDVFHILCGLSVESPVEIPLRPCREGPFVRLHFYWATRIRIRRSGAPAVPFGYAASEGRASFVARRAVNLHGCALPHSALPPAAAPPKGESRRGGRPTPVRNALPGVPSP